jgi:hypothetical protein
MQCARPRRGPVGACARHTHVELLRYLKQIDRETPKYLDIHLIQDNYATHKHPKVKAWLERHPRRASNPTSRQPRRRG